MICALGLTASKEGIVVDPKELLSKKYYNDDEEQSKGYIISGWIQASDRFEILGRIKARKLNQAIRCLCGAAVLFAADVAIFSSPE